MNGSGRKRQHENGSEPSEISSPASGKIRITQQQSKVQMSLFSFGFGPANGNKRQCVEAKDAADKEDTSPADQQQSLVPSTPEKPKSPPHLAQVVAQTPPRKTQFITPQASPVLQTPPKRAQFTPSKQSPQSAKKSQENDQDIDQTGSSEETYAHLSYAFLEPSKRKDINMRKVTDPEYDPKTLYVPPEWLKKNTPAMQQWWSYKQRNMDAILFFKMGKFYELFNQDAVIGVNELDLRLMKSSGPDKPAHAGFPESSRDKYERLLVEKGYKVMRIEQTETPAMMDERRRTSGLKASSCNVVMREICQVTTLGTRMWAINASEFHSAQFQYLLALNETSCEDDGSEKPSKLFGVCFLDVTIGKIYLGQFKDDNNLSNLNILLAHISPKEILYERNSLTSDTHKTLLKTGSRLEALKPNKEFWPVKKTMSHLKVNRIFSSESGVFEWPQDLKSIFEEGNESQDLLSLEPREEVQLAMYSFGAIVHYLNSQLIEKQVLAHASFEIYTSPLDQSKKMSNIPGARHGQIPMVLDHVALRNLEIFKNSSGETDATLFTSINYCKTHFGQRLLKTWICSPLCDVDQIQTRLDAVEALISNKNASLMNEIVHMLSGTKDLERMLSKIKNHCFKSESDSRAIMFDNNQYNKAKVTAFITLLDNFKRIQKFIKSISSTVQNCDSKVLKRLLTFTSDGGLYPDYGETIKYFEEYFDHAEAQRTGQVVPADGVNKEYDECSENIKQIEAEFEEYLDEQKSRLGCKSITYFGSGKNRYQLQVPEAYLKKVPSDWRIETGRAGYKRFYTPFIDDNFGRLTIQEEKMKRILNGVLSGVFEEFLRKARLWSTAIDCIATLDVVQGMAKFSRSMMANDVPVCRPKFIDSEEPQIHYKDGRHPTLVISNSQFISNDLTLDARTLLLSGANMGGKSTLMRQTALLVILAQIGCFVPASEMSLTPVDRVFSRLGASDRLLEGESTFYTELVETSAMLRCATKRSLLLLDELGRGTSTFDGTAIAYSVIQEISNKIKCCCLFSTHYHTLTRDFVSSTQVRLAHMACQVDSETDVDEMNSDPLKENITFLYKIADGPAARSYGYNVAKLAGIPREMIKDAYEKSKEIELNCKVLAAIQSVCRSENMNGPTKELKARVLAKLKV